MEQRNEMMNSAKIIAVTQPHIKHQDESGLELTAEEFIAYTARVSNPSNQFNTMTARKLLKYLLAHKHFSPFEMVNVVMSIETTRDIAHQIVRHRSFSFQEFSQRYADPTKDMGFMTREARLQDVKNRQNSIEITDDTVSNEETFDIPWTWEENQKTVLKDAQSAYNWAIRNGIAKEQARAVLPEGLTKTRLYMAGTLRSWIHYIDVRAEEGTQKEHREIAIAAREEILKHFPSLNEYYAEKEINELLKDVKDTVPVKKSWWKFWS